MFRFFRSFVISALVSCSPVLSVPVLVHDNGPVNGSLGAHSISATSRVAEDFVVASTFLVTEARNVGVWVDTGAGAPQSVQWSIFSGTMPGDSQIASGTAEFTNALFAANGGYDVYSSSFAFGTGVNLIAGTYWLELTGATKTDGGNRVFWDANTLAGGNAYIDRNESPQGTSFQIFADAAAPEISAQTAALPLACTALIFGVLGSRRDSGYV